MVDIRELLKAGAHFGHQRQKWNPKMKPYIFTERNGVHIINLEKTLVLVEDAKKFVKSVGARGGDLFLVGTKRQAQDVITEEAARADIPYVNYRWLGGMLTNFQTINESVKRLAKHTADLAAEKAHRFTKKELITIEKKRLKLSRNLSGIITMTKMPSVVFIVDPVREHLAVREARKLNIPIIAIVDTNGNPDDIDHVIPANDDGMRTISLIMTEIVDAWMEGHDIFRQKAITDKKEQKEKSTKRSETRKVAGRKVRVKRVSTTDGEQQPAETAPEKTEAPQAEKAEVAPVVETKPAVEAVPVVEAKPAVVETKPAVEAVPVVEAKPEEK